MPVTAHVAREFPAGPDAIAAADDFLGDFGKTNAIPERVLFRARVCVAELMANALEHGQASPDADCFTISAEWNGCSTLDVEFTDTTAPFDPTRHEGAPDSAPYSGSEGGRGLRLMRGLASGSRYRHDGERNRVSLRFLVQ